MGMQTKVSDEKRAALREALDETERRKREFTANPSRLAPSCDHKCAVHSPIGPDWDTR